MAGTFKRVGLVLPAALVACERAFAQAIPQALPQAIPKPLYDPPTGREAFLAAAIGVMMLLGLASFLLTGRVSERTHVALAMLSVLTGAFGLMVLFGGLLYDNALTAGFVLLLLIALFKFMSQFESNRGPKSDKK